MHRTISISCFNVLSRVNDFDRCCFFYLCYWREDISVRKCWKFNIILFCHFKISLYILWWTLRSIVECILFRNVLSHLHFFTFEFQLRTLWDRVYKSNINVTFCCCKTSSNILFLLSSMSTLKFYSYIVAFIFTKHGLHSLQIICFVKLFSHSLVMDPTGQENIARNINTWARQPSGFFNR